MPTSPAVPWLASAPAQGLVLGTVLLLVVAAGFLSGAAAALTTASRSRLRALAAEGSRGAALALTLAADSPRLIGVLRLGGNAAIVLATALTTLLALQWGGRAAVAWALPLLLAVLLLLAEVLPRSLAALAPERAAIALARPVRGLVLLLAPLVAGARGLVRGGLRLAGLHPAPLDHSPDLREEILGALAEGTRAGQVEKEDRDRLLGALDLGERTVEEAMRHRSGIEMLDADLPLQELVDRALASPHSRLPLYREEPENIVGVLHSKDLMRALHAARREQGDGPLQLDVVAAAQKPWFVPETTALDAQMRQFLKRRRHFALVVDEYGTLQGLITLEDILEEIVGEIADEYDTSTAPLLRREEDGAVVVDGAMAVRDFNRATDWSLPDEEANTIAGLLIHEARTIPEAGQQFLFFGWRFEVLQRKGNRLARLRIRREAEPP